MPFTTNKHNRIGTNSQYLAVDTALNSPAKCQSIDSPDVVRDSTQGNPPGYKVRLVADISAAAFRTHQDKEIALWHCLRSLILNGRNTGLISYEKAVDGLHEVFGYSRRTANRLIKAGDGIFWTQEARRLGSVLRIKGIKNVCLILNTSLFNDIHHFEVDADDFNTLLKRRRAMYSSIARPNYEKPNTEYNKEAILKKIDRIQDRKVKRFLLNLLKQGDKVPHPVSRATIEEYTGLQRRRQQRYDAGPDSLNTREEQYSPGFEQPQRPNVYVRIEDKPGNKGQLIKVRRLLKPLLADRAVENVRRYFNSPAAFNKCKDRWEGICFIATRRTTSDKETVIRWKPELSIAGV